MEDKVWLSKLYENTRKEKGKEICDSEKDFFDLTPFQHEDLQDEIQSYLLHQSWHMPMSKLKEEKIMIEIIGEFCKESKPYMNSLVDYNYRKLIQDFRQWFTTLKMEKINQKYERDGRKGIASSEQVLKYLKALIKHCKEHDWRPEVIKGRWDIRKLDLPCRPDDTCRNFSVNFTGIEQLRFQYIMKKATIHWITYLDIITIRQRIIAFSKFSQYLMEHYSEVNSLEQINRDMIEDYLMYKKLEIDKNPATELKALKATFVDFAGIFEKPEYANLMMNTDIPRVRRSNFQVYSNEEQETWKEALPCMEEQVGRALLLHMVFGTRISEILALRQDCISFKKERYWVRIDSIKGRTYQKPITTEIKEIVEMAIQYTKTKYHAEKYIFVDRKDPDKPMPYTAIRYHLEKTIQRLGLKNDQGEPFTPKTHIFRHCYGVHLTEMHIPDLAIAELLGHSNTRSVSYYRRVRNKLMAEETRKIRAEMDRIIYETGILSEYIDKEEDLEKLKLELNI